MGIICACLPLMRQLLRKAFPRIFDTTADYYAFDATRDSQGQPRNAYALDSVPRTRQHSEFSGLDRSRTKDSDDKSTLGG